MSHIRVQFDSAILAIAIDRPEKKNAITSAMYAALADAFEQAASDDRVRVLLVTGSSDCFTAGNDIRDFLEHPPLDPSAPALRFLRALAAAEKPLVAAVAGPATGIGTTMLLHCDVVFAAPSAVFSTPFVNLGLVPEAGSSLLLAQRVGQACAARMLLLGEPLGADAALAAGLVGEIVPAAELADRARRCALDLAAKAPAALLATKRLMRRAAAVALRDQMAAELEVFTERLTSAEAREAFSAFVNKGGEKGRSR